MPLVKDFSDEGEAARVHSGYRGWSPEGLVDTYNVPAGDRFQIISQHDPDEFIFDTDYLGIHRTPDAVFIHIFAGDWRDSPTKQTFYKRRGNMPVDRRLVEHRNVGRVATSGQLQL
jgi:Tautomerase enzyme